MMTACSGEAKRHNGERFELVLWGAAGWDTDGYGEACIGTRSEVEAAARSLWALGDESFADARFAVREVGSGRVDEVAR